MGIKTVFADEFRGFARSKVMLALWIGMPLLSMILRYIRPDSEGIPLLTFVGIILASVGGTVSAVSLSTSITSERNRHVYDLFLVRPISRANLLIAKFIATFCCLVIAVGLSVGLGIAVEAISGNGKAFLRGSDFESVLVAITGIGIACAVGILFGVLMNTVAVSAILSAYLGNQITGLAVIPMALVGSLNVVVYCIIVGTLVPAAILTISIVVFSRKAL